MEQQQPSGHRPEGFCCSIMVGCDICRYCEVAERSVRRTFDGKCMLTAVVDGSSEHRLSTAVQGDIPSTMRDLMMLIAVAHRYACAVSVQTCGSCSIKWQSVAAAHRRVLPWCQDARGSQSSLMRRGRPITAVSGYQLLMLDGPSTGGEDPVVCGAVRLRKALQ